MRKLFILFTFLSVSLMGFAAIDWASVAYLGSTDPSISMNTYKYAVDTDEGEVGPSSIANIQPASGESRLGFYSTYGQGVSSCSHDAKILGDQVWLYVDQLTEKDTKITVTLADASVRNFHLWYKNGGAVDPDAPHASGKGFGTYIAKNVPFYTRVDNKADETQAQMGTVDLFIITYGNKIMGKAKLNNSATFSGNGYSMQFRIWNDAQTGFSEQWAQLREENTTVALIDMSSNYSNLNQGVRTELPMNTYMETSAGTGAVPMFTYTLDYINAPIAGDATAPTISSAVASYSPITGQPTIVITAADANDMFYKIVDPSNNVSYSFSNTIQLTTDGSNNVLTYTVYAIDYNGNISSAETVNVQMKPALSNIALNKSVSAGVNQNIAGRIVDGNFNGDRWSSAGAIHYDPVNHPDDYQDWFYINFVNIYDLSAVRIKWETARPNNYTFRTSIDGTNWTTVATYTEYPTANAIVDYILPANTQGRFFGVWATSGYDNLNWGMSPFEVEVYGAQAVIEDHNPPTLNSAILSGQPEWNQVRIAVEAEDTEDPEIYVYHVVDATNSIDQECMVSAGIITVTGLSGETTYALSVTAVDGAGNESDAIVVNATTPMDTTVPLVAAPTPDATGKEIRPIYSDAFAFILAHPFDKDGWGGVPLMEEKNISGDNCLVYNVASANEVLWGMYDNGANAIIAADGYHSATGMGIDASAMTNLHLDIWSLQACNNCINININDAALKTLRLSHAGTGWQSYDIPLSEFQEGDEGKKIDNVRWMKFNGIGPISGKMALDNVYFWAPASNMKSVSASSNNTTMGSAIVKQGDDEVTMVEENTQVTFIATANEGYSFINWTNLGNVASTNANYTTTITETTNLVANFDYTRTTYCHTLVQANNNDRQVYVTVKSTGEISDGKPVYRIEFTGVADNAITGIANFNVAVNNVTAVTEWIVETNASYPYGHIYRDYAAANWRNITFGAHHFNFNAATQGFYVEGNFAVWINWDNTCTDTEAPAFNKAEAEVLSATSVRLKIKATDNWGGLLTYTIAREAADPIIANHASGEEFTQEVTGLTAGTEYDFTVTVSDGVNNANTHIVVTPVADNTKPYNVDASLVSKTWNAAVISVAADDDFDAEITKFRVVNETPAINLVYVASEGKITVTDLVANTDYNFTITALDAADNESELGASVAFKTLLDAPNAACANPTWPADQVKAVYSPTYSADCNFGYWESGTAYAQETYGKKFVTAGSGYFGLEFINHLNCANMEKLHLDIWIAENASIGIVPIWGGGDVRAYAELTGQQWNSVDLDLSTDYAGVTDWSNVYQLKIDNAANLTFWIANVYFYRTTAIVDNDDPTDFTASLAEESYFSVKINAQASDNSGAIIFTVKNGDDIVATQNAASAAASVINITGLNAGTAYNFNVYVADEAGNTIDPIAVAATTLAAPAAAPEPTLPSDMVKSIYSEKYTSAIPVGINFNEWWWQSPTVAQEVSLGGNNARYYSGLNTNGSFGITWSGDHKLDAAGYQIVHFHIYPTNSATIEIYPVIQPEGEFHRTSQTLVGGQWNEVIIDYSDKTFAPFNQFGIVYTNALGDFFIDNLFFEKSPNLVRDDSWMAPGELGTICIPNGAIATGGDIYELVGKNSEGKIVFATVPNNVMEPGKPYLFEAKSNAMNFYYTAEAEAAAPVNTGAMKGTFADITLPDTDLGINDLSDIYYFADHALWSCADISTLSVPANRAYVKLSEVDNIGSSSPAPGRRYITMGVNGKDAATGFDQLNASDAPMKMIIDGQLFILRGEKLYDATGRLVK